MQHPAEPDTVGINCQRTVQKFPKRQPFGDSFAVLGCYAALVVVIFRRFGAASRSHLQGPSCQVLKAVVVETALDLRDFSHRVAKICSAVSDEPVAT